MESKNIKAISLFKSGYNCAQAVVSTYADEMAYDNNLALSISCGFGAGMGRLQETCGAVTGSFMLLSIYNCTKYSDNGQRKDNTYTMIQEFSKKFNTIHGTLQCRLLLNCDLRTEEGQQYFHEHNLMETVCEKCISTSVDIVEELLAK